jgi:hypothetical protein
MFFAPRGGGRNVAGNSNQLHGKSPDNHADGAVQVRTTAIN